MSTVNDVLVNARRNRDEATRDLRTAYSTMADLLCDPGALETVPHHVLKKLKRRLQKYNSHTYSWKR